MGVCDFCVASVEEGLRLRRAGITGEILILGYTDPEQAPLLEQYRLTQTVLDCDYARMLDSQGHPVRVHIKVDTGMHRLGERWNALDRIMQVFECTNLQVTGLFTHFASERSTPEQGRRFYETVNALKEAGITVPAVHCLSSHSVLSRPELGGSYARVGIALYGLLSSRGETARYTDDLRPVLSLKARVAQVRELQEGERAGYDARFTAQRRSRIASLTIGYADGFPRGLSLGVGSVLLRGGRVPVTGLICMDQTLVDVTDIPGVSPGDEAVLIGRSGSREITACDIAEQAGTISNEILSRLGSRLERIVV